MGALAAIIGPAWAMAACGGTSVVCTLALFRSLIGRVAGSGGQDSPASAA
jgi:hypothetical protein